MFKNNCRICGLYIEEAPWGENEDNPTYEICPCCGVEFGNEDYTLDSIRHYRERWLKDGAAWFVPKLRPKEWNIEDQLKNIPQKWI